MKREPLLDDVSSRALDFAFLRDATAPASSYGEGIFSNVAPYPPGDEQSARDRANEIATIASELSADTLDAMREIFRRVADATSAIARASMGDALSDANFLELQRFFDACMQLDGLNTSKTLRKVADQTVRDAAGILERGRAGKFGFYLDDAFDAALATARTALKHAQAEYDAARGREAATVAAALGREVSGTEFIVMRSDVNGTLPQGVRVVREAATYYLCEIDADDATIAAMKKCEERAADVASAEERVRRALTDAIRERAQKLYLASVLFGQIDMAVAAARFTQRHDCHVATIGASPTIEFEEGRFLPLALQLEKQGREFTPISVKLDGVAVLTGPNMGGKSVCLRTAGFIAMCAAFGLPVPAKRASVGLFAEISWLGVGTEEADGGLLSSFAREVVRLRDVLAPGERPLLALMDEFARTTTPREGHALLVAVLREFGARQMRAIAATHLAGVAGPGGARHFAVRGLRGIPNKPPTDDLDAALATLAASMDYTIEEVTADSAGGADAIALASLLGLEKAVTDAAYAQMKEEK